MFYGDTVQETRHMFFSSWDKYLKKTPLSPLENEIVQVILIHPEYHHFLENPAKFHEHAYYPEFGETNPFLHMGLHLAIREQIATNRPAGIEVVYDDLIDKHKDIMTVEHLMMEQLAEYMWLSQKNNMPPDEEGYLNSLDELLLK